LDPFKQTGAIWRRPRSVRRLRVQRVCKILERAYGTPRLGNPPDPLDDMIYIVLSNRTSPATALRTYRRLQKEFRTWDAVLRTPASRLRALIKPAGLSNVKSRHLRAALRAIKRDFGACNLNALRKLEPKDAEQYLVGLPGVSEKVAKCIMLYTLGFPVLPVDAHAHRISRRLGWTARKRADQCHAELEALVPPRHRLAFHVDCIEHGRRVCKPHRPLCQECCINRFCPYFRATR